MLKADTLRKEWLVNHRTSQCKRLGVNEAIRFDIITFLKKLITKQNLMYKVS